MTKQIVPDDKVGYPHLMQSISDYTWRINLLDDFFKLIVSENHLTIEIITPVTQKQSHYFRG